MAVVYRAYEGFGFHGQHFSSGTLGILCVSFDEGVDGLHDRSRQAVEVDPLD